RPGERAGRAGVEAAGARAAALRDRRVGRELERRHDLAEEDERSLARHDQEAVLADESEPGARRPRALEDRDVVAHRARSGGTRGSEAAEERGEAPELLPHAIVVVAAARVAGDEARRLRIGRRLLRR